MKEINWEKIFLYYNNIKKLYIECEETDPELQTNLQPLNEFRAALDHLMRIVAIEKLEQFKGKDPSSQAEKLLSHLRRAFYDICDMLSMNYRNKIIDSLELYSAETIKTAIPNYYSEIRPEIEKISLRIADLRANKAFDEDSEENNLKDYMAIVSKLRDYYVLISERAASLKELDSEEKAREQQAKKETRLTQIIIPAIICIIGVVVGVIGWII